MFANDLSIDKLVKQIWECALKFDVCCLQRTSGTFYQVDANQIRKLLKEFVEYCEENGPSTIGGFAYDDRLTKFLEGKYIQQIKFFDYEEGAVIHE